MPEPDTKPKMPTLYLDRTSILAKDDITTRAVPVPEWGGSVHVRGMTAEERDAFEAEHLECRANFRARLAVYTLCDKNGANLFAPEDLEILASKSGAALDRVFAASARLNRITKDDQDELEGN